MQREPLLAIHNFATLESTNVVRIRGEQPGYQDSGTSNRYISSQITQDRDRAIVEESR